MDSSAHKDSDFGEDGRVIDRSGDIDQRPPEERVTSKVVAIHGLRPPQQEIASTPPAETPFPPHTPPHPSSQELSAVARRLQKELDTRCDKAAAQLEALMRKVEAQEKRCVPPKLDNELQQIRFQRQKVLIAHGPALAARLGTERSRLADLVHFKSANGLLRDAHYPSSPLLSIGILAVLILLEAGINGVLFAESSDQGLFGGWLEALVLAVTNIGSAFLFGRLVLPQLHRKSSVLKTAAAILCLVCLAGIVAVNLLGSHYRDYKTMLAARDAAKPSPVKLEMPAAAAAKQRGTEAGGRKTSVATANPVHPPAEKDDLKEQLALKNFAAAPFAFDSFLSFFLFVIGLCGAAIAAGDGYKLDDPFPGYGRRHRRYTEAQAETAETLRRILVHSNAIMTGNFQWVSGKIENFSQEMAELLALHHAHASERKILQESLDAAAVDAEAEFARHGRLINKVPSQPLCESFAFGVTALPGVPDKQIKFYETQDKKLKALQKNLHKDRSDVLGMFEAASGEFQRLLLDASQESLKAAGTVSTLPQDEIR
jgi:hypothetical protein